MACSFRGSRSRTVTLRRATFALGELFAAVRDCFFSTGTSRRERATSGECNIGLPQNNMSYANYEFSPGATLSVAPTGARGRVVEARWALGLEERLGMDLTPAMATGLRRLPAAFGVAEFERAIGDRSSASLILRHLLRRGLVIEQPARPGRGAATPGRPGTALGRPGMAVGQPTSRLVTTWPLSATAYQIVTEPLESDCTTFTPIPTPSI